MYPTKSGIEYGFYLGYNGFEFVIMYIIGMKSLVKPVYGLIVNLVNYLNITNLFIYLGCNNYKKNLNNGFISFSECLKMEFQYFYCCIYLCLFSLVLIYFSRIYK